MLERERGWDILSKEKDRQMAIRQADTHKGREKEGERERQRERERKRESGIY